MSDSLYAAVFAALCVVPVWTLLVLRAHLAMWRNLRTALRRSDDVLRLYDVTGISTETRSSGFLVRPTARIRVDLRRARRPVVLDVRTGEDAALISARILAAVEDRIVGSYVRDAARPHGAAAEDGTSWWSILGVERDASVADINAAWKGLARDAHPDRGGSNERMAAVNAARAAGLGARRRR